MSLDQAYAHCPIFPTAALCKRFDPYLNIDVTIYPFRFVKDFWLGIIFYKNQLPNLIKASQNFQKK